MSEKSFKKEWDKYFRACFPTASVGQTQYNETQQAFYAGAMTAIGMLMRDTEKLSEQESVRYLNSLYDEIETATKGFINRFAKGRKEARQ